MLHKDEIKEIIKLMQMKFARTHSLLGDDSLHNNNYKVLTSAVASIPSAKFDKRNKSLPFEH
jgi:hypothetical protein